MKKCRKCITQRLSNKKHYYTSVGIAKQLGIATGIGGNRFNPKAFITREDMMVMAARAMKAAEKIVNADISVLAGYKDSGSISSYAKASVAALVKNGIIIGDGNLIYPKKNMTRAETAVVIYRISYNINSSI
jgi:S-layer homology domain.